MQLLITGLSNPDRPILAIKAVRSVTGLGLRESKTVVDRVLEGNNVTIEVSTGDTASALGTLTEHGVLFRALDTSHIVLSVLRAMPRHLTVAEVLAAAEALGL